jgi:hypothetical protein
MTKVDRSNIVESKDVVHVAMCNQDRIEPANSLTQRLLSKIGRRVDEYCLLSVFDKDGRPQSLVSRVV